MKILRTFLEKDKNMFYAYITINADNTCLFYCGEMDKFIFNKLLLELASDEFEKYFNKSNTEITAKTVMVMIYKLHNYLKNIQETKVQSTLEQLLHQIEKYNIETNYKELYTRMAIERGYKSPDTMFDAISAKEFSELVISYKVKEKVSK